MAERRSNEVSFERIDDLSIVSLKVARSSLDRARERLGLPGPLSVGAGDPQSLWLGPDRWLLVSDSKKPVELMDSCGDALSDVLHNAVDYSSGLSVMRVAGPGARWLLASGTGFDLRPQRFATGSCCRTRLAQIAAVIVAAAAERFDVYVDRSYETYLTSWLAESSSICHSYMN